MPEEPSDLNTTLNTDDEDDLRCCICNLQFESETERNMHVLAHPQDGLTEEELLLRRKLFYKEVKKQQNESEPYYGDNVKLSPPKSVHKPRRIYKPPSKRVGLTKIRMEDCLRCDACSCIYIDPEDYYKHMRNFHQKYNTVIPRTRRRSPVGQSRTVYPLGNELRVPPIGVHPEPTLSADAQSVPGQPALVEYQNLPRPKPKAKPLDTTFIAESIIRQGIKSRWSKVVSERLTVVKRPRLCLAEKLQSLLKSVQPPAKPQPDPKVKIKEEPVDDASLFANVKIKQEPLDDDMSAYLLSQVEVKIKTEPPDDYGA